MNLLTLTLSPNAAALLYLVSAVLFILALRGLSSPETARRGNLSGIVGMVLALGTTLFVLEVHDPIVWGLIGAALVLGGGIGATIARTIPMTAMPQLVAAFHSLVGLAAVLVACAAWFSPEAFSIGAKNAINSLSLLELSVGLVIGAITFSGSVIAFAKLQGIMSGAPIVLFGRHFINLALAAFIVVVIVMMVLDRTYQTDEILYALAAASFLLGFLLIIPIGGADMPVVISMLNSYSGWAAAGIGFTLSNMALIITGALVGSSGAILSYIMCRAMNRSFISVILGGFGATDSAASASAEERPVKRGSADDAAFIMKNASHVIIVPGYGMAVAQAQHALKEMADLLKENKVKISYAIHPVAGRMPGHMNVLLAEANVPYDEVFELENINSAFRQADVAFVIGANDVTNPAARDDSSSPIYGMPVLDVDKASTVLFIKRSMAAGYAGIGNELFFRDNTMMLFDDAKKMVEDINKSL
jgi:NAD(P) transhydrogenase subunit beta